MATTLIIQGYHNDLIRKRSMAVIVWENDSEKALSVEIPFDCPTDQILAEVNIAVRALARELETAVIRTPQP